MISFVGGSTVLPNAPIQINNTWMIPPVDSYLQGTLLYYAYFNQHVLTHEAGHYYGLLHPYENSCGLARAQLNITDTPRMRANLLGPCTKAMVKNSCKNFFPNNPPDDPTNFMISTNCRNHFTTDQIAYMQSIIRAYKPLLVN